MIQCLVVTSLAIAMARSLLAHGQIPQTTGKSDLVRDFILPDYYPSSNGVRRLKTRVVGAEARLLSNGVFALKEPRLESYREDGVTLEWVAVSPECTVKRPGYRAAISSRAGRHLASRSIAMTCLAPSISNARVRPPGPGPISTTVRSPRLPERRAILRVKLRSSRKFWPNDFFALRPCRSMMSRSGGKPSGPAVGLMPWPRETCVRSCLPRASTPR